MISKIKFSAGSVIFVATGAVLLLVPAVLSGRPFIYYDTWEFYSWGQDVLAAISNPWPAGQPFPIGRDLWASKVVSGLPATVDETQFRLTLSTVGSRSAFYAVPLYALRSLWVAAGVQTLLVSWTLWLAVHAFGWRPHGLAFVGTAVALMAGTTLPFASAFLMPDIFAGLAALAAGLLLFFPDRLSVSGRWGLSVLIAYAVVAHTSNVALVAAAIPIGAGLIGLSTSMRVGMHRTAPVCGALLAGVVVLALGAQGLKTVFGRPVQNPPFLLARVIVDGPGLAYLQEHCTKTAYVSCELTNAHIKRVESFLWGFVGTVPFSPRFDPDRRERFYAEQWEIVAAAIGRDPLGQLAASLRNAATQLASFRVGPDMIMALVYTLRHGTRQGSVTAAITPNVEVCQANGGQRCYRVFRGRVLKLLHTWHYAVVACSGFLLAYRLVPALLFRERRRVLEPEQAFALFAGLLVLANAVLCGVLSNPSHRYQARIVWLIPLAALVLEGRCGFLRSLRKQP
jgi:hypothetical protein